MNEDETGRHTAITVEIAGESYTLRTDADAEHARRCAALVDARMRAISGDVSPVAKKTAIMAALSLADELFKHRSGVRKRSRAMADRIGTAIEGPTSED